MKRLLRAILFTSLVVGITYILQKPFLFGPFDVEERVARDNHHSYYEQEENTLDVVLVGGSNIYTFWQSPLAWSRYGLASHTYSNSGMPATAIRYIVESCRTTQPNALYVISVNNFKDNNVGFGNIHYTTDDIPLGINKVSLVNELCTILGVDFDKRIELLFPLYIYHSRWADLKSEDFDPVYADVGGAATKHKLFETFDMTKGIQIYRQYREEYRAGSFDEVESESKYIDVLKELLAYLREEDVNVLFVLQPQAISNPEAFSSLMEACETVQAEGFDLLELDDVEGLGLNPAHDYIDYRHTNIHGSIKYTDALARYLIDTYDLPDRRGEDGREATDEAAARYETFIQTWNVFDFELDLAPVDEELLVSNLKAKLNAGAVELTWMPVEGADRYLVYRKTRRVIDNPAAVEKLASYTWERMAELPGSSASWEDQLPVPDTYEYAVIPTSGETYGTYAVDPVRVNWKG